MTRPADIESLWRIYRVIERTPGLTARQVEIRLSLYRSAVYNRLPVLEANGFLLYEDDDGQLYPYKAVRQEEM